MEEFGKLTPKIDYRYNTSGGFRFGKNPPVKDYRTFLFINYIKDGVPKPPDKLSQLDRVYTTHENSDPTSLFPMLGNDTVGDCTIAAYAHADTVYEGMVGKKKIMSEELCVKIYMHLTGGIDSGLSMMSVMEYVRRNTVMGDKILAYVSINPHNHTHVKQAIAMFGGLYTGFQVQENCIEDFKARKMWEPGELMNAGHAIFVPEYNEDGVNCLTWGNTQWGSWKWWDECVDETFVLVVPEAKDPKFTPGFDFEKLQVDLVSIADWGRDA
jgi:hypothetical protein